MNKTIILIGLIISCIFFSSCTGKKKKPHDKIIKNDLTDLELKGKVKSVKEKSFSIVDKHLVIQENGIGDTLWKEKSIYLFDERGNKIMYRNEYSETDYDGTGYEIDTIKYDAKGKMIEKYTYKSDNKLNPDISDLKDIFKYDNNGNVIEDKTYLHVCIIDNCLYSKMIYKYDDKGNMTENGLYGSDGKLMSTNSYKYDDDGYQIEWIVNIGGANYKNTMEYDEYGNRIETCSYNSDGSLFSKSTFKFDEKGNSIERNTHKSGDGYDSKYSWKYVYDKTGNWIKLTEGEDGNPQSITVREIKYY